MSAKIKSNVSKRSMERQVCGRVGMEQRAAHALLTCPNPKTMTQAMSTMHSGCSRGSDMEALITCSGL